MSKDRVLFLVSLACLGLLAAFLFRSPSSNDEVVKVEVKDAVHDAFEKPRVLVAKQPLHVGESLDESRFTWKEVELEEAHPTMIYKDELKEKWLSEAVVAKNVDEGEVIQRLDLLWPQEVEAAGGIPVEANKLAVPLSLVDMSMVSAYMVPGKRVDVILTTKPELGFGTMSVTLIKGVRVLLNSQNEESSSGRDSGRVILEMTPQEAEIYSYAQQSGTVTFGVREGGISDDSCSNGITEMFQECQSSGNFNSLLVTYLIRRLFPQADINIDATTEGFIASGKVKNPQTSDKIIEILAKIAVGGPEHVVNLLDVVPQQVMICVKVLEVDRTMLARVGLNWKAIFDDGDSKFGIEAKFPRPPASDPNYIIDFLAHPGDWTLSAIIDLLQERGCGRVIAEPNLTTISGQTAHFFAGGEIPILVPQGGTLAGTVTVVYKKYGVILDFTPVVDLNGLITLYVAPEVSRIDKENSVILAGFVIPGLTSRRASTTVKLWSGQCYAIAGLLQNERITNIDSLCGLDRLPVIGPIFRSRRNETKQTELMIVLAPYLVNTECQELAETVRTDLIEYECHENDCMKVVPKVSKPCPKSSKRFCRRHCRKR